MRHRRSCLKWFRDSPYRKQIPKLDDAEVSSYPDHPTDHKRCEDAFAAHDVSECRSSEIASQQKRSEHSGARNQVESQTRQLERGDDRDQRLRDSGVREALNYFRRAGQFTGCAANECKSDKSGEDSSKPDFSF